MGKKMLPIVKTFNALTQMSPVKSTGKKKTDRDQFKLVKRETHFDSSDEVMRFLPDILGRALARSWIDKAFLTAFMADPKGVLAKYAVFLPETVEIEIETEGTTRPKVVVYDRHKNGKKLRLMYLQLVMMAGK